MKRLKIIFDANPLIVNKSGVGYYTQHLVLALAHACPDTIELLGHYFNFLGRRTPSELPKAANINYIQSRVIPGKVLNLCRRFGFQPYFEIFTRHRADVTLFPNFVALPGLSKTPAVVAVHDLSFIDCPEYVSASNRSFLKKWVPSSIEKSELVITISNFTKSRIMQIYDVPENKIHITPIPPPTPIKPNREILRKYGLSNGYLLFVGTIEPRKNIIGLVNAYALLPVSTRNNLPLVLVGGSGWNDQEILTRIKELQVSGLRIIQTGYVSQAEKSALYGSATLCVQPSHYEGFGMPVLEAMSYGKPVACSDIEVLHEVAGDAAVYFDQTNQQAMADTLTKILYDKHLLEEYAMRSKKHIANFPTWPQVATELYDKLQELL